ncbi:MAG: polya polymerase [Clostridiales bacterium]|jgi:hypothetical protein|nr:polya polymerase [Clostridiales bacterium]
MKILNIVNPERFFIQLQKCKGDIFLLTSEGDKLNLRSKLCQYIAMSKLFGDAEIDEIELSFTDPGDVNMLLEYLVRG